RRDVHLPTGGAPLADRAPVGEGVDVGGLGAAGRVGVVEPGGGDDAGDRVRELTAVACRLLRFTFVRLEAGDVGDGSGALLGPADADAHAGAHGVGNGRVEGVQKGRVGAVEADQDPGEGSVEGLAAAGFVVPGPGGDRAGGGDFDEFADLLGG